MRNVWKKVGEKIKTHFTFSNFFSENHAVSEIMSKNLVEPERTQTIWRLRVAYWISKPTRAWRHARPCAPTLTLPPTLSYSLSHTQTHARPQAYACLQPRARAHARTRKYVIIIAFHGNNDLRTLLNVTLNVHCLSCFQYRVTIFLLLLF